MSRRKAKTMWLVTIEDGGAPRAYEIAADTLKVVDQIRKTSVVRALKPKVWRTLPSPLRTRGAACARDWTREAAEREARKIARTSR